MSNLISPELIDGALECSDERLQAWMSEKPPAAKAEIVSAIAARRETLSQTGPDAERSRLDFLYFCESLQIPCRDGDVRFDDVMADFQRERFREIEPALQAVAAGRVPTTGRYWWEATKGASKDSDLAVCLLWLLAYSRRSLQCQVGAADQDQADELRKAAKDILWLNPWLAERVACQNWRLVCESTRSACDIVAADVAGSHGARPDVLILNELSHITKEEFASNLMDNAAKVPHGLVCVATNAGFLGTWQARWREIAADSTRWRLNTWSEPAPWLDPAEIDEAELRNSRSRFQRLFWGVWVSGAGDAIDPADIEAAMTQTGPMTGAEPGYLFVAGLDLGAKRDHSALVILGCDGRTGRVRLAQCQSWRPGPRGTEVDLSAVEAAVLAARTKFRCVKVGFDPHQALLMAQRLRRVGVPMTEVPFVGRNLNAMATCLLESFATHNLDLYQHPALVRDISRLQIVEKAYGYKLESVRDDKGHADTAIAFAIALPFANRRALRGAWSSPVEAMDSRSSPRESLGTFVPHRKKPLIGSRAWVRDRGR